MACTWTRARARFIHFMGNQSTMTETQFQEAVAATLAHIETALEGSGLDADCALNGLVLNIRLEGGATIVVNAQAPTRQLWLAARSGAYHYAQAAEGWRDVRSGEDFYQRLSQVLSEGAGRAVVLRSA
jgi:CyaY protein